MYQRGFFLMDYTFTKNKDGHKRGERISLDKGDWRLAYWTKKGCICICDREAELEVAAQEPVVENADPKPKQRRKKR